jgi:hypothetical protein
MWESQFPMLDLPTMTLLRIIEQDPEGAKAAIAKSYPAVD